MTGHKTLNTIHIGELKLNLPSNCETITTIIYHSSLSSLFDFPSQVEASRKASPKASRKTITAVRIQKIEDMTS